MAWVATLTPPPQLFTFTIDVYVVISFSIGFSYEKNETHHFKLSHKFWRPFYLVKYVLSNERIASNETILTQKKLKNLEDDHSELK